MKLNYKKILSFVGAICAMSFGVFMIIFGEADNSPGAQFLGLIMFVIGVAVIIRNKKKKSA